MMVLTENNFAGENSATENQQPQSSENSVTENSEPENTLKMSFSGSIETGIYTNIESIRSRSTLGSINEVRLIADVKFGSIFRVFIEPMFLGYYGNKNPIYSYSNYGVLNNSTLNLINDMQTLGNDKNEQLIMNRAYGSLTAGKLSFSIGKQIISWKVAYSFNPLDKINTPNLLNPTELSRAIMGLTVDFRLYDNPDSNKYLTLNSYILLRNETFKDTPLGLRLKYGFSGIEGSVSYIYEVKDDIFSPTLKKRKSYIGADLSSQFLGVNLYFEGSYQLEKKENRHFPSQLIIVCGFSTTVRDSVTIRLEYIYYGPGKKNKSDYQVNRYLYGLEPYLANHYVFFMLDGDVNNSIWLGLSVLWNANDKSGIIMPAIKITPVENVKIEIGAYLFFGKTGTEFYGRFMALDNSTGSLKEIDFAEHQFYLKMKISF